MPQVVVQMLVPLGAVAFSMVVTVLAALRKGGPVIEPLRQAILRACQYAAVIGVLDLVSANEPALAAWATAAMYVIGLSELASGIAATGIGGIAPPAPPASGSGGSNAGSGTGTGGA